MSDGECYMIASTANIRQVAQACLLGWARGQIEIDILIGALKAASPRSESSLWLDFDDCVGQVLGRVETHDITFDGAVRLLTKIAQA